MAIANTALTDTFDVWRTRTNQLVSAVNQLETVNVFSVISNSTPLIVNGDGKRYSNTYLTLAISSNVADVSTTNVASPYLSNVARELARSAFNNANSTLVTASAAYAQANAAFITTVSVYTFANLTNITVGSAFTQANTGVTQATIAYNQANVAYGQANTAYNQANAAYTAANNVVSANNTVRGISRFANAIEYIIGTANTIGLNPAEVWATGREVSLTDAATISLDMATFINANVTLGGNRTLGNPTNPKIGQAGYIRVAQDATGSRTLAYSSFWKFAGNTTPTLSTTASSEDILFYQVLSNTRIFGSLAKAIPT